MQHITIDAASQKLHELIAAAIKSEEIIITKDQQPMVKLTPVIPEKKRSPLFGSAKDLITISDNFDEPLEELQDYM